MRSVDLGEGVSFEIICDIAHDKARSATRVNEFAVSGRSNGSSFLQ